MGSHWFAQVLRELLCDQLDGCKFTTLVAKELDSHVNLQEQSIGAMISELQDLKKSIANAHKKMDALMSRNKALLDKCAQSAMHTREASKGIQRLETQITVTRVKEVDIVLQLRKALASSKGLPPCLLTRRSSRHKWTPLTCVDYSTSLDSLAQIIKKSDMEELSACLKASDDNFNKECSAASATLESLRLSGNGIKSEERRLREVTKVWKTQPAQWCLGDRVVEGHSLKGWMDLITGHPESCRCGCKFS